jgi:hypothetical protein
VIRHLPLISDRDRIAAARYAAEKLAVHMATLAQRRKLLWSHYSDSAGAVISENQ